MQSLFLKIFVWFWLATALVGSALVVSTALIQTRPVEEHWRVASGTAVAIYAQTAADLYEREGAAALLIYCQQVERAANVRAMLFDARGEDLLGRGVTPGAREFALRAGERDSGEVDSTPAGGGAVLLARRVQGPRGARYVFVGEMRRQDLASLRPGPGAFVLPLLAVILTAGLVCYGLARYLAAPVVALRAGVRRIAGGDLSARVSSKVGERRDELADLARDFDLMAERIESLVLSQRRLLGDISHELRSPLARLTVALGLARQRAGEDAHELQAALDRIEREAERLNMMIGELLTLTRLESDAAEVRKTRVDLHALVRDVVADADYEARNRDRGVRAVALEECHVSGNSELLRSAVENVVRNAIRYTAEGTAVEVELRRRREGGSLSAVLRVRDHGRGVPEGALGELFRPFYRVADARERQTGGVGLGLAITERAVRLHGGSVAASNAAGGGLLVEIHLPATAHT